MKEAGWEIATHGYKWIDYRDTPAEEEARDIAEAIRIHTEVAGERPLGFYQGRSSINTIRLGMEEGGFLYCADSYADDLPYWIEGPQRAAAHRALHARFQRHALRDPAGFQFRRPVLRLSQGFLRHALRRRRDRAEDAVDRPALPPGRAAGPRRLARALPRLCRQPRQGLDRDPARHRPPLDRKTHPPAGGWKPSKLTRTLFVERFGGVYEHSRWVAEAAYDAGLSAGADSARGLGARDGRARRRGEATSSSARSSTPIPISPAGWRSPGADRRIDGEQASAGLDRLSADELARFTALNDAYRARFGFPFIMAVKGKSKAEILAAFERRLEATTQDAEFARRARRDRPIAALRLAGHPVVTTERASFAAVSSVSPTIRALGGAAPSTDVDDGAVVIENGRIAAVGGRARC